MKTFVELAAWDESQKEQIVKYLLVVENKCKTPDGRKMCKMCDAYDIVCEYLERLNELNFDQKAQFIRTFDSLLGGTYSLTVTKNIFNIII